MVMENLSNKTEASTTEISVITNSMESELTNGWTDEFTKATGAMVKCTVLGVSRSRMEAVTKAPMKMVKKMDTAL
jgi:spermidine/putrescine-binding protein